MILKIPGLIPFPQYFGVWVWTLFSHCLCCTFRKGNLIWIPKSAPGIIHHAPRDISNRELNHQFPIRPYRKLWAPQINCTWSQKSILIIPCTLRYRAKTSSPNKHGNLRSYCMQSARPLKYLAFKLIINFVIWISIYVIVHFNFLVFFVCPNGGVPASWELELLILVPFLV